MFTGIIETIGIIEGIVEEGTNKTFWVNSALGPELRIDQSLSHNGVCLTVEETEGNRHRVTAVQETINKTSLGSWKKETSLTSKDAWP